MTHPQAPLPPVDTKLVHCHEAVRVLINRRADIEHSKAENERKRDELELRIAAEQISIDQINETLTALGADLNQQPEEDF